MEYHERKYFSRLGAPALQQVGEDCHKGRSSFSQIPRNSADSTSHRATQGHAGQHPIWSQGRGSEETTGENVGRNLCYVPMGKARRGRAPRFRYGSCPKLPGANPGVTVVPVEVSLKCEGYGLWLGWFASESCAHRESVLFYLLEQASPGRGGLSRISQALLSKNQKIQKTKCSD